MNTDFYLERGKDHVVCEDFATAGIRNGSGFAVLSDGCSSSSDVDFGSRILVHAAKDTLLHLLDSSNALDSVEFARRTLAKAEKALRCFPSLPDTTLDATMLLAVVRPDSLAGQFRAQVCFWGDGVAIVRKKDRILATSLHFADNAPFYLSYALNGPRRRAYVEQQKGRKAVLRITFDLAGEQILREDRQEDCSDPLAPLQEQFDLETGDSLALVSDGITQFFAADNTPIPWETLAPKFVDFKKPAGVFVRRRMNFFERENRAVGVRHLDDVSVAAITLLS